MKVVGICGPSGVGKTTLVEKLIPALSQHGCSVSVIKHAHKDFEIDRPGKDSWRHRQAGAQEVLIASGKRLAKLREFPQPGQPSLHQLLRELIDCDWVLAEGFKHADVPKIEVVRAAVNRAPLYPDDPFIVAVALDSPASLPCPTRLPLFDLAEPQALASYLIDTSSRYDYDFEQARD